MDKIKKDIIFGVTDRIGDEIMIWPMCVYMTDNEHSHNYVLFHIPLYYSRWNG